MAMSDIVARGYTREQVLAGDFPWWISMPKAPRITRAQQRQAERDVDDEDDDDEAGLSSL